MALIYQLTNIITQDQYIGKTTKTLEERFYRHVYHASHDGQTHLHRAMRKYGIENFIIEIVEETTPELINERECHHIKNKRPSYNMTAGGDGGDTSKSDAYQKGMNKRNFCGSNNPMYGKKRTDTAKYLLLGKEKMIEANRCPVSCEGIVYPSVGEAQKAYPGIAIRKRLGNPKYPTYFRLREATKRK